MQSIEILIVIAGQVAMLTRRQMLGSSKKKKRRHVSMHCVAPL
jgi:hypothetical protein